MLPHTIDKSWVKVLGTSGSGCSRDVMRSLFLLLTQREDRKGHQQLQPHTLPAEHRSRVAVLAWPRKLTQYGGITVTDEQAKVT